MSLKQLRKQATQGPNITCPGCGQSVPMKKISMHHVECPAWKQAKEDSVNPNKKRQMDRVMQKMSLSERWAPAILDSEFVRHHWLPAFIAIALVSWLVGYTQPQGTNSFVTIVIVPGLALGGLAIITFLDWRGMTKRWESPK